MSKFIALAAVLAACVGVRAQDAETLNLIKAGEEAARRMQYAEADLLYAKAAARGDSPDVAPALWYLGTRAAGQGNRLAAEGFFERLLRLDSKGPYAARALTWLGNLKWADAQGANSALPNRDDAAAAESLFQRALALQEPGTHDARETTRSYANLLRRQGRLDEAKSLEENWERGAQARSTQTTVLPKGVYRAGGGVTAPQLLYKVEPEYTETAQAGGVQGTVLLRVDIDAAGWATNVEVQRSLEPGLDQQAARAVRQWRFQPGTKDGTPVTVRATIEVNFRLK